MNVAGAGGSTLSEREQDSEEGRKGRAGTPVDPLRMWHALRSRWTWIFLAGVVGAFLGAAVAKKFIGQTFASRAVLAYQGQGANNLMLSAERQTTLESLTLTSNLAEVAKRMKLALLPDALRNFVTISTNEKTNIVMVDGSWATPDGAS